MGSSYLEEYAIEVDTRATQVWIIETALMEKYGWVENDFNWLKESCAIAETPYLDALKSAYKGLLARDRL